MRKVTDAIANVIEEYRYDDYGAPSFFNGTGTPLASPKTSALRARVL